METFAFKDIHTCACTIIIGKKSTDSKASAMHELIKYVHPASVAHIHVDPSDYTDKDADDVSSYNTMRLMFDYVFIYPDCQDEVFLRVMEHTKVKNHVDVKEMYMQDKDEHPMVLCFNRFNPVKSIQVKRMVS